MPNSSATLAAISAPKPATWTASCTTSSRRVRAHERMTASRSHGQMVRRSMSSADTPSAANCATASAATWRMRDQVTTVRSAPSATTCARPSGTAKSKSTSPRSAHSSLCSM